ncbi:phosphopantetheine-binding protein [Streptomyces sp. NPDC057740]|uniref:acyl carrier protein n=1 Tax=Streptomyces sp. NPDC057740 TaxID=3346234 RepID=UPI0036932763
MVGDSSAADAIVGLGCRPPGGLVDLAGLWEALEAGRDLVGEVPADRFEAARFVDPQMARPRKSYTAGGGFLTDWSRLRTLLPTLAAPRFAALPPADGELGGHSRQDLVAALAGLSTDEALQAVSATLAELPARILRSDVARLDPRQPLQDHGVDSLMAVELLTTLRQRLDVEIPPMELLQGGITLTDLARHVLLRLGVRTTDTANG